MSHGTAPVGDGKGTMRKYAILLVDDDVIITAAIGANLEEKGYAVTTANSGEDAILLLHQHPFDLVITDLMMSPMDGIDVLKETKKIDPDIMVMVLTGFGDMTSAIQALQLNADDYMLKPCEMEEMFFRVSRCLEKMESKRKIRIYENILAVCCVCKRIKVDKGGNERWISLEEYMQENAHMEITSLYCPECQQKMNRSKPKTS